MIIKQTVVIIALSCVVLFANSFVNSGLHLLADFHLNINHLLSEVFSGSHVGSFIRKLLALLVVPALTAGIPAGIYWAINRRKMPYIMEIIWSSWIVLTVTITLLGNSRFSL